MTKKTPPHVLTEAEVAALVAKNLELQATVDTKDAEIAAMRRDIETIYERSVSEINGYAADMTSARKELAELRAKLADCVDRLNKAQDPVHGIEPPRAIADIPSLDKLPAHKPID